MATIHFDMTVDNDDFIRKLREAEIGVKDASKKIEQSGMSIEQVFDRIKNAAALSLAGFSAKEFITSVAQVRGEFQQLEVAFNTMLGSKERADELMRQLVETAATTPFDLQSVSNGAKQLLAYGEDVEKVNDDLVRLGNIAAGLSQPLGDIVYLYGTTMTQGRLYTQDLNQFTGRGIPMIRELAKVFGVAENEVKGLVEAGKVGFPEVQKVIMSLTDEGGMFFNLMSEQSKTITGRISNIEDAFSTMLNDIGKANEGVIYDALEGVSSLIENYEKVGKVLLGIVSTYGAYKAAIIAVTALENVHHRLLLLQTAAQKALNAAMLTNPYVLAATAAAGIISAMWAFHDSATEAEKAQRRMNERQEEAARLDEERKQRIDSLIQSTRDIALSDLQRSNNLAELRREYPKIFEQYDIESIKLANVLDLKRQIADEDARRAGENKAKELSSVESDIRYYEKLLKSLSGQKGVDGYVKKLKELRADRDVLLQEKGKGISEQFISGLNDIDISKFDKYIAELEKRIKGKGGNGKIKMRLPIDIKGTLSDEAIYDVKDIKTLIDTAKSKKEKRTEEEKNKTTYHKDLAGAKEKWEREKKEYEAIIKDQNATTEQVKKAKEELDKAAKDYKDLGGDTTGRSAKASYKESEKRKEMEQKLSDELLAIQRKNRQDEINLMEEGTEKKLEQIKFEYELRKQEIEKQERELAKANKEAGITEVNANGLTYGQQADINSSFDINILKMNKSINDLYKSGIDRYQSYTDQRIAIEKKFNDDIALLQEARNRAEEKGNADEISKIDRSIAKATSERGKELMAHDLDVLKQSPEYIRAFEDLKNTSSETLNSLLNQLENAKQIAAQTLNPEDLREYTTTIQEIMDELDSRNPFKTLADRQRELAEAENVLAEAKKQLDSVNKGAKIVTGSNIGDDGKMKLTYLSAADALNKYKDAKDKHQKANNKFIKAEKDAIEKVDELSNAIKELGGAIGGQAGEIISIMGDVALFATTTIDGIGKVSQAGANAISAVEKASVILGIISTAIQLLQKISELGNNKAFKQYEAYAEKVKEINALTDAVNEYRIASLEARQAEENWFSEDNLKTLRDYKKVHDEVFQAYVDKAGEAQAVYQNQSGGGWLTGAFNWVMGNLSALSWWDGWKNIWGQGDYDKGTTAAINNLRIETRKKSSGFLGTGIGGKSQKTEDLVSWARKNGLGELFDDEGLINKELAQSLIDNYGNKLVGQTKETLEALIALREQYDEYINQLHEYVSSLYEPLVDNFVDSLWDWFDNGKDALDSFKEYASDTFRDIVSDMMRTIVLDKIVGAFSDDIAALYEEYAKGTIDETELMKKVSERTSGLIDNYEENLPILQGIMNQVTGYLQGAGIDLKKPESYSQQASSKGFEAMSQDTGNELNGRFTALQASGEEIKNQMINAVISLNSLVGITADGNSLLGSILNQHLIANSFLEDIAKYTKPILDFGAKFDKIVEQTR